MASVTICFEQVIHTPISEMTQMQNHQTSNPQVDDNTVDVVVPDRFRLFLSEQPRVNPHYDLVKKESEAWFVK